MFGWTFKIKAGNLNYFSSFKTVFKKVQIVAATFLHAVLTCFWTKL